MAAKHIELQGQKGSMRETLQQQMTLAVDLKRKNVIGVNHLSSLDHKAKKHFKIPGWKTKPGMSVLQPCDLILSRPVEIIRISSLTSLGTGRGGKNP